MNIGAGHVSLPLMEGGRNRRTTTRSFGRVVLGASRIAGCIIDAEAGGSEDALYGCCCGRRCLRGRDVNLRVHRH